MSRIVLDSGAFFISSVQEIGQLSMMTGESVKTGSGSVIPLKTMQVFTIGDLKIVPQKMTMCGFVQCSCGRSG